MSTVAVIPYDPSKKAGRPRKFKDDAERLAARREQIRRSVAKHREKRALAKKGISSTNAELKTKARAKEEHGDDLAQPDDRGHSSLEDPHHTHNDDSVIEHILQRLSSSFASAQLDKSPYPNVASLLLPALVEDFKAVSHITERWWRLVNECSAAAQNLIGRSSICAYAVSVGRHRQDRGLLRLGESAIHSTIRTMCDYTELNQVAETGVGMVIAARNLIYVFGLSKLMVDQPLPLSSEWEMHASASDSTIVEEMGPASFKNALAADVLLGQMPITVMGAFKKRQSFMSTSQDWLDVVQGLSTRAKSYIDTIWPLALGIIGLMQETDEQVMHVDTNYRRVSAFADLQKRIKQIDERLDLWHENHDNTACTAPQMDVSSQSVVSKDQTKHPQPVTASSFTVWAFTSQVSLLYYGLKLEIAKLHAEIEQALALISSVQRVDLSLDGFSSPAASVCQGLVPLYAGIILQKSLDYYLDATIDLRTLYTCYAFPLRIAWQWYASQGVTYEQEAYFCADRSKFMRMSGIYGRMAEHILDVLYWQPPNVVREDNPQPCPSHHGSA